jgi:uncharacterized protein
MPASLSRHANRAGGADAGPVRRRATKPQERRVLIAAGRVKIRAALLDTPTADRLWRALPLHSTAETWGRSIRFETPVESGRERNAVLLAEPGDICFLVEDDRVIIAFGATPISRPGEMRLPRPCNLWARAPDDVGVLKAVRPGEKVSLTAAQD